MRRSVLAGAILAAAVTTMVSLYANAQEFHAKFSGFNEIGPLGAGETGAIFSQGQAALRLKASDVDVSGGRSHPLRKGANVRANLHRAYDLP